jgi:uracil DNA glycosylase
MFNDLHKYIPESWKIYINDTDLNRVIERLNKHNPSEVLPLKENIFECLRYIEPEDVHTIILGYPSPQRELSSGISYSIPFEYRFTDIYKRVPNPAVQTRVITYLNSSEDTSLKDMLKKGILLMNYPLTCVVKRKYAHMNYGWNNIIKNIIERLLYRNDSRLTLIAWNADAFELFNKIVPNWIPTKNAGIYNSPMHNNPKLIVSMGPEDTHYNENALQDKYKTIIKNIPFGSEIHRKFMA